MDSENGAASQVVRADETHEETLARLKAAVTPKQSGFCHQYAVDFNALAAYVRAGYSEKGAGPAAHKLLKNANVEVLWKFLARRAAEAVDLTAEMVRAELRLVGFSRLNHVATWREGQGVVMIGSDEMADAAMAALGEISETVVVLSTDSDAGTQVLKRTRKFKMHPKVPALAKLGESFGLFTQVHDFKAPPGGIQIIFGDDDRPAAEEDA